MGSEENSNMLGSLAATLRESGFHAEERDGAILIAEADIDDAYILEDLGGFYNLSTVLYSSEEMASSEEYRPQLNYFLLKLQRRALGCVFAYDDSGALGIEVDLYPAQQDVDGVVDALDQLAYVANSVLTLLDRILSGNDEPNETEIEDAFNRFIDPTLH